MTLERHFWQASLTVCCHLEEDCAGLLVAYGALGVQSITGANNTTTLLASYSSDWQLQAIKAAICQALAPFASVLAVKTPQITRAVDQDWEQSWRQFYHPFRPGEHVWIVPSWQSFTPPLAQLAVIIEPGMAFGTGQHETTQLCLRALERLCHPYPPGKVLDLGCGTGILAIAALKLGCQNALGLDVDHQAVIASRENGQRNHCSTSLQIEQGTLTDTLSVYDVICANILKPVLLPWGRLWSRYLRPHGKLLLSGFLNEDCEDLLNSCQPEFICEHRESMNDWAALTLAHRPLS